MPNEPASPSHPQPHPALVLNNKFQVPNTDFDFEQSRVKTQILGSYCVSDYSWSQSPHWCVLPPTYLSPEAALRWRASK